MSHSRAKSGADMSRTPRSRALYFRGLLWFAAFAGAPACERCIRSSTPKAQTDIQAILRALEEWAARHDGRHPATLVELVTPDEYGYRYLSTSKVPRDPWKQNYQYAAPLHPGDAPRVWSIGRDGALGGDDDIESWNLGD